MVVYAFAAWTLFVWTTRIRNIVDDPAAGGVSRAVDLGAAGVLVALGVLVAVAAWRGRPAWALPVLVVATVATWAVRVPLIIADPRWTVGFEVVHTALAVVSVALAYGAWRARRSRSSAPSSEVPAAAG